MPLVTMRQLLDEAAKGGYGIGAFNVNNLEQVQAIMEAARETYSPVIIQASQGARKYANDRFLYHLMQAATEVYPEISVALHQDHGNSVETCKSAIELGFTSVMMDGSLMEDAKTPADFEYNVCVTREVVEMAHERGVTIEDELGTLGGIEDDVGSGEVHLTEPDREILAMHIIEEINQRLPTTHLVMHGSSSVPKELVDIINRYGGEIRPT
jgi:fructose-bisphosphate aldolase class II